MLGSRVSPADQGAARILRGSADASLACGRLKVTGMASIIGELHERALVVGFDDGALGPGGPAPGRREQLDHLENGV